MRNHRAAWTWALVALAIGPGCSEELGPERMVTTRVSGVVLEGSQPVGGGWVEFMPVDGTVGNLRSARIGPDGRFVADGVAVGENAVGIVGAPIRMRGGRRAFDTLGTPIRRNIPKVPAGDVSIDLLEEAVRSTAAGAGRAAVDPSGAKSPP